jgi:hypothetical protein
LNNLGAAKSSELVRQGTCSARGGAVPAIAEGEGIASISREFALSETRRWSSRGRPSRRRLPMLLRMRLAAETVAQCTAAWKDPAPLSFTRAPASHVLVSDDLQFCVWLCSLDQSCVFLPTDRRPWRGNWDDESKSWAHSTSPRMYVWLRFCVMTAILWYRRAMVTKGILMDVVC